MDIVISRDGFETEIGRAVTDDEWNEVTTFVQDLVVRIAEEYEAQF